MQRADSLEHLRFEPRHEADVAAQAPPLDGVAAVGEVGAQELGRAVAGEEAGQHEHGMTVAARRQLKQGQRGERRRELGEDAQLEQLEQLGRGSGDVGKAPFEALIDGQHARHVAATVPVARGTAPAQPMCRPPLTEKSAPVANPDSSDATHDTIEAMSSGVPSRFTGMWVMILSSTSRRMARTKSVAM